MTRGPVLFLTQLGLRAHWTRVVIIGGILFCAVSAQLYTSLADRGSRVAVTEYGAAVFGYGQTFRADAVKPPTVSQARRFDAALEQRSGRDTKLHGALAVEFDARLLPWGRDARSDEVVTIRSVPPGWSRISASMDNRLFQDVVQGAPSLYVMPQTASRVAMEGPWPVSLRSATEVAGSSIERVGGYPGLAERNTALDAPVLVGRALLDVWTGPTEAGSVFWVCEQSSCLEQEGLIRQVAQEAGLQLRSAERVDRQQEMEPLLEQQRRFGWLFSFVVMCLGLVAITAVSVAFIEIRAPEFITLRTLGVSRLGLVGIVLAEMTATSLAVALTVSGCALLIARVDPNIFNTVKDVALPSFTPPWATLLQSLALTLGLGWVLALLPAVRAYRLESAS